MNYYKNKFRKLLIPYLKRVGHPNRYLMTLESIKQFDYTPREKDIHLLSGKIPKIHIICGSFDFQKMELYHFTDLFLPSEFYQIITRKTKLHIIYNKKAIGISHINQNQ